VTGRMIAIKGFDVGSLNWKYFGCARTVEYKSCETLVVFSKNVLLCRCRCTFLVVNLGVSALGRALPGPSTLSTVTTGVARLYSALLL